MNALICLVLGTTRISNYICNQMNYRASEKIKHTIMKMAIISFITLLFILTSCEKENQTINQTPGSLIGCWINPQYNDSIVIYEKAPALIEGYGFNFKYNDSLIERKNAGWCGTPPITFGDFDGTYSVNDSIITASVGYWGGTTGYTWKLLSLDNESLTLKLLNVVYTQK